MCLKCQELGYECSHCMIERKKKERETEKQTIRDVINLLGGPVMSYSPENEVQEHRGRIAKAVRMLIPLAKEEVKG